MSKQMKELTNDTKASFKRFVSILSQHYAFISAASVVVFYSLCIIFSTLFLLSFDIRLSLFSGITGALDIALANGYAVLLLMNAMLIAGAFLTIAAGLRMHNDSNAIIVQVEQVKQKVGMLSRLKASGLIIAILTLSLVSIGFTFWTQLTLPHQIASNVKGGFSERYNIEVKSGKSIKCVSLIAGISEYLLAWDNKKKFATIIPKNTITGIEISLPMPPQFRPIPQQDSESEEEFEKRLKANRVSQQEWSNLLKSKCNQTVVWP